MKNTIILTLFCTLLLASCAKKEESVATLQGFNKTGYPIVDETYEFTAVVKKKAVETIPHSQLWAFQEMEKKTNVHVNFEEFSEASWKEQKPLILASNDLPDVFWGDWILENLEINDLAKDGVLLPVQDLIEDYMPNLKAILDDNPEYRKSITAPDGSIYGFPSIEEGLVGRIGGKLLINMQWLDTLGLEVPTTTDELKDVLRAFKTQDPNGNGQADEIPLSFQQFAGNNGLPNLFGMFGLPMPDQHVTILVEDGKVKLGALDPRYKEAIVFFNELMQEGLMDREVFVQDANAYKAKLREGRVGLFVGWSRTWAFGENNTAYQPIYPPMYDGRKPLWTERNLGETRPIVAMGITTQAQNVEVIARWADELYDQLWALQMKNGPIGEVLLPIEGGKYEFAEGIVASQEKLKYVPYFGVQGVLRETGALIVPKVDPSIEVGSDLDEFYLPIVTPSKYKIVLFTDEEARKIDKIKRDFKTFYQEKTAQWIQNGGIEEEWDSYLQQMDTIGVQDAIVAYQEAYDRLQ